MRDPQISSFQRPISPEDRLDIAPLYLGKYDYTLGMIIEVTEEIDGESEIVDEGIPLKVGRFIANINDDDNDDEIPLDLRNCKEVLSDEMLQSSKLSTRPESVCL